MDAEIKHYNNLLTYSNYVMTYLLLPLREPEKTRDALEYELRFSDLNSDIYREDLRKGLYALSLELVKKKDIFLRLYLFDEDPEIEFEKYHKHEDLNSWRDLPVCYIKGKNLDAIKSAIKASHNHIIIEKDTMTGNKSDDIVDNKIKNITFVREGNRAKTGVKLFYINDDMSNPKIIKKQSAQIKRLITVAETGKILFNQQCLDYLNTNKKCTLYCSGKYDITKILIKNGANLKTSDNVILEIITWNEYQMKLLAASCTLRRGIFMC
jgi:hypothetical protein